MPGVLVPRLDQIEELPFAQKENTPGGTSYAAEVTRHDSGVSRLCWSSHILSQGTDFSWGPFSSSDCNPICAVLSVWNLVGFFFFSSFLDGIMKLNRNKKKNVWSSCSFWDRPEISSRWMCFVCLSVILIHSSHFDLKHTEAMTQCYQRLEFLSPSDGWFAEKIINLISLNTSGASVYNATWMQKFRCICWEGKALSSGP